MAKVEGFRELSRQLSAMGMAAGGKALRSAAMTATLPVVHKARANIPVGSPPYERGSGGFGTEFDPYPTRTYKGRLKTPGFAKRNIARKSILSKDKRRVKVLIGVRKEAFYAINFIEFGIPGKIAKKPWLEPAFRASRGDINDRMRKRLKVLIDRAAKK